MLDKPRILSLFPNLFNRFIKLIVKGIKCLASLAFYLFSPTRLINEQPHEISSNVVCVTSKASDQTAHMHSLIRAFASGLNIL